ncbi:DUF1178 family protein [Oceanibacterium hippocampi]|uniref:Putative regulatory protein FmdB zinc ribbon domain-containing protein n=1 Tax=Oceanibacterium hippocampi TaxID=745714 RepID=A0A1Y5R7D6_9PROT|nr:DUF1178 family protein [Oceanibacterium hippocampi]SLN10226.1 hypothetical protein OCH7691_00022 [Oceanibacterium hippocampi]
MIVYDLKCRNDHQFEAWFRSSDDCDEQVSAKAVSCPICGSSKLEKALMAPALASGRGLRDDPAEGRTEEPAATRPAPQQVGQFAAMGEAMRALRALREHVEKNSDYVGERFVEEARKIHHGETEKRNIYGEATLEQASELKDEGIDVAAIPWLPRENA